jgi:3-methyladenine DNA glycosylase/8-oxoguanine DNA glycosylase
MASCQGLPDEPCPFNNKGTFGYADLSLCQHCKATRQLINKSVNESSYKNKLRTNKQKEKRKSLIPVRNDKDVMGNDKHSMSDNNDLSLIDMDMDMNTDMSCILNRIFEKLNKMCEAVNIINEDQQVIKLEQKKTNEMILTLQEKQDLMEKKT